MDSFDLLNTTLVANADVEILRAKHAVYGDSWRRRGGVGAFMMLARKWDRIERQLETHSAQYDVFHAAQADGLNTKDGLMDDIADLRRYLLLVEAHLRRLAEDPHAAGFLNEQEQALREQAEALRDAADPPRARPEPYYGPHNPVPETGL